MKDGKTIIGMNNLRDILNLLLGEKISMSRALEMFNEIANEECRKAFESAWTQRMNREASEINDAYKSFTASK